MGLFSSIKNKISKAYTSVDKSVFKGKLPGGYNKSTNQQKKQINKTNKPKYTASTYKKIPSANKLSDVSKIAKESGVKLSPGVASFIEKHKDISVKQPDIRVIAVRGKGSSKASVHQYNKGQPVGKLGEIKGIPENYGVSLKQEGKNIVVKTKRESGFSVIKPYEPLSTREKIARYLGAGVVLPDPRYGGDGTFYPSASTEGLSIAQKLSIPLMAPEESNKSTTHKIRDDLMSFTLIREGGWRLNIPSMAAKLVGGLIEPPPEGMSELEWKDTQIKNVAISIKDFFESHPTFAALSAADLTISGSKATHSYLTTPSKFELVEGSVGGKIKYIQKAGETFGLVENLGGVYKVHYPLEKINVFAKNLPKEASISKGAGEFTVKGGRGVGYTTYDIELLGKQPITLHYSSELLFRSKNIKYELEGFFQRAKSFISKEPTMGSVVLKEGASKTDVLIRTELVGVSSKNGFNYIGKQIGTRRIPAIDVVKVFEAYKPLRSLVGKNKYFYSDIQLESGFRAEGVSFGDIGNIMSGGIAKKTTKTIQIQRTSTQQVTGVSSALKESFVKQMTPPKTTIITKPVPTIPITRRNTGESTKTIFETKSIQLPILSTKSIQNIIGKQKQQQKVKQRLVTRHRQKQNNIFGDITQQFTKRITVQDIIGKQMTRTRTKTITRTTTSPFIQTPPIAPFVLKVPKQQFIPYIKPPKLNVFMKVKKKSKKSKRPYEYTPSLGALFYDIESKRKPNIITGLEVRPILK